MTLYWLQCGGCGGDTWSLSSASDPDLFELRDPLGVEILWHPSLSADSPAEHHRLLDRLLAEAVPLDILVVEGAVVRGPGGTGMYDTFAGRPKKDLVARLAAKAQYVVAAGTCASFGGVGSDGEIEACGVQWLKSEFGGFLGPEFRSRAGLPVVNLPGCPVHAEVLAGAVAALVEGRVPELNDRHCPSEWYNVLVHQGCVRNEYHEYRVEEEEFGQRGCLFFYLGCRGPLTHGPCNKVLWLGRNSRTRAGIPCVGCTSPDFPQPYPFFQTRNIEGIPIDLPEGVDRAHYLAYKGMAAAAAPERLARRETRI